MSRKKIIIAVVAVIILGVILALPMLHKRPLPEPATAPKEQIKSFIAGREFIRIPMRQRHDFMKSLRQRGITHDMLEPADEKERENFRRNIEFFKQERVKIFFSMSPEEQTQALQEAAEDLRRESRGKKSSGGSSNMSHRKALEGQSPEDRARSVEFARRLKKYMNQEK